MNCETISSWTIARILDVVGTGISEGLLGNGNRIIVIRVGLSAGLWTKRSKIVIVK